jgi:hypothetical protein
MLGVENIMRRLLEAQVTGELWVDGSFITEEINPFDADLALCASASFRNDGTPEQKAVIDWLESRENLPGPCDCAVSLLHSPAEFWHPFDLEYREHLRDRLYGTSRSGAKKGIAVIALEVTP